MEENSNKTSIVLALCLGIVALIAVYIVMRPRSLTTPQIEKPGNLVIDETRPADDPNMIDNSQEPLANTNWKLVSYIDEQNEEIVVPTQIDITADFSQTEVSGSGGCNGYSGGYTNEGNGLSIEGLMSTKMYCETASEFESKFMELFQNSATYEANTTDLTIYDASDRAVLKFMRVN